MEQERNSEDSNRHNAFEKAHLFYSDALKSIIIIVKDKAKSFIDDKETSIDEEFKKLQHHLHSSFEKSIIERTMQYIKDRTENSDDYFLCRKKNCKLKHVTQRMNLFAVYYNKKIIS